MHPRNRKLTPKVFLLTFAFYSPIVRGGRGNGKRVARQLHCRIRLSRVGRRPLRVPSRKRGEGSTRKSDPSIPKTHPGRKKRALFRSTTLGRQYMRPASLC